MTRVGHSTAAATAHVVCVSRRRVQNRRRRAVSSGCSVSAVVSTVEVLCAAQPGAQSRCLVRRRTAPVDDAVVVARTATTDVYVVGLRHGRLAERRDVFVVRAVARRPLGTALSVADNLGTVLLRLALAPGGELRCAGTAGGVHAPELGVRDEVQVDRQTERPLLQQRLHETIQVRVVGRVLVCQRGEVLLEKTEFLGQTVHQRRGVGLLDNHNVVLLLLAAPRQLSEHELNQQVEQRPQVIHAAELLALVRANRGVPRCAAKARLFPGRTDLARLGPELSREPEVDQVAALAAVALAQHEVRRLDVAVKVTQPVDTFDGLQHVHCQLNRRDEVEFPLRGLLPHVRDILPQSLHHKVVDCVLVPTAGDVAHDVGARLQVLQGHHLQPQHHLLAVDLLALDGDVLARGLRVDTGINLTEGTLSNFLHNLITFTDNLTAHEEGARLGGLRGRRRRRLASCRHGCFPNCPVVVAPIDVYCHLFLVHDVGHVDFISAVCKYCNMLIWDQISKINKVQKL
eukprot:PhM_4_TR5642/c0_g2_i1/m.90242